MEQTHPKETWWHLPNVNSGETNVVYKGQQAMRVQKDFSSSHESVTDW